MSCQVKVNVKLDPQFKSMLFEDIKKAAKKISGMRIFKTMSFFAKPIGNLFILRRHRCIVSPCFFP